MITGVILARNEAHNIVDCAMSLRPHVDLLFLIDTQSTDCTVRLARPLVDRVFTHEKVANFDAARNIVIPEGNNDWFWFLDADERVSERTGQLVNQVIRGQGDEFEAISIPFLTHFCGKPIKHSGWWPGYTMPRVLKRGHFKFSERLHGGVEVDGREIRLPPDPELAIQHFSYQSVQHYLEKVNRYTSTEAGQMVADGQASTWHDAIRHMVHDLWMYYERSQGHLDKEHGWILAWLSGQYRWLQHAKLLDLDPNYQGGHPQDLSQVLRVMSDQLARLRASTPRLPLGIIWKSPLLDYSGYAEEGRTLVKALARADRPIAAEELRWNDEACAIGEGDAALIRSLLRGERPDHSVTITDCIPTLVEPDPRSALNVLRTTFETDRVPDGWRERLEKFDEIWVISRHNYDTFRRSWVPPEKLRIVPSCIDAERFASSYKKFSRPDPLRERFVFLSIFDWQLRKGWDVLLRAWCKAFTPDDRAGLLLKITRMHGDSLTQIQQQADRCLAEIAESLAKRPDIVISDRDCGAGEIAALYHSVDAFVLASRGEGWGRPYMEAMAAGLPVIGSRGSGNVDFMNDDNSFLVSAQPVDVPDEAAAEIPPYAGHRWFDPDESELVDVLRQVRDEEAERVRRATQAAEDVRDKWGLSAGRRAFESAIAQAEQRLVLLPAPEARADQIQVAWEGELFAGHSFSAINERLAEQMIQADELALSLARVFHNPPQEERAPNAHRIRGYIDRDLGDVHATVRHAFPPNWAKPASGKWIHIQPWEFGHLPSDWIRPLQEDVAEVWAPSSYVKRVYERSGIPGEKVHVIPWGVAPDVFNPQATSLLLPTSKTFVFLFVGGTIRRKGIDTLLEAYTAEFAHTEDVCLCVKDMGTQTFYRYGNYRAQIQQASRDPGSPEILYFEEHFTAGQLASLYAACHAVVLPYRGEGFGLPILEAMACGRMPIVPRGGASDDFVTDDTALLLDSREVETTHDWQLAGPALELEISVEHLRSLMRCAFEQRDETSRRGRRAAEVAKTYTWSQTAHTMTERIKSLVRGKHGQTPSGGVAACLLTRDAERQLPGCLAHIKPFVDQLLVLDSHSRDRTVAIAREYGAAVQLGCELQRGAEYLRGQDVDWVFWLKPGDVLAEEDAREIRPLLTAQSPRVSQVTMQRSDGRELHFTRAGRSATSAGEST